MPKFLVEEVRNMVSRAEIAASNAQEALYLFRRANNKSFINEATEDVHTTAIEINGEGDDK